MNSAKAFTIKSLKKKLRDNDIVVSKADTGNTTVLMHKSDYISKTEEFLITNNI